MSTIVQEALRYREALNLGVFPVDPSSKMPRFAKWQRGGLRAPSSIESVFGRNLDAAIGVPGGQILAPVEGDTIERSGVPIQQARYVVQLDVDERNFGIEALSELPNLPRTATAKTPNGYHFWFWTRQPVAAFTRPDGLELKGLGAFTIEPPAPERAWTRNPFDYPIAEAPSFLVERPQQGVELLHSPSSGQWSVEFGDPLELIRRATPGARRATLLRQGRRLHYQLVQKGLAGKAEVRRALGLAALENGTDPKEIDRLLKYVFNSPWLTTASLTRGGAHNSLVVPLSRVERAVLKAVWSAYEPQLAKGVPLPNLRTRITSHRWLAERADVGLGSTHRALVRLSELGLVWKARSVHLKGKGRQPNERACGRYRPTFAGVALASGGFSE